MFIQKYWLPLSVCLVAVVSVGLYLQATHPPPEPIKIYKPVEPLATPTQAPTTQTPVVEKTEQGGHWHGDEWHAEPHTPTETPQTRHATHTEPYVVSDSQGRRRATAPWEVRYQAMHAQKGAGNPPPFENVPVDLYDFEATKATMIEKINFVKAHWDPKVSNSDVGIAQSIAENISNAAEMPLFTREQRKELIALYLDLLKFQGIEPGRTQALMEAGYTREEADKIATEEILKRWGLK